MVLYSRGRYECGSLEIGEGGACICKKSYVSDNTDEPKDALIKRLTAPGADYNIPSNIWNSNLIKNSTATKYPTEKPEEFNKNYN